MNAEGIVECQRWVKSKLYYVLSLALTLSPCLQVNAAVDNPFQSFYEEMELSQAPITPMNPQDELDLAFIAAIAPRPGERPGFQMKDYIPMNMRATNSQGLVATKIATQSVKTMIVGLDDRIKKTRFAVAAKALDPKIETKVEFKSEDSDIKHSINLRVVASSTTAFLVYSGYVNANFSYQIENNAMNFEMNKDISKNTQIVFNHEANDVETADKISFRYSF